MEIVSNKENKIAFLRLVIFIMVKYKIFNIKNLSTIRIKWIEIIKTLNYTIKKMEGMS